MRYRRWRSSARRSHSAANVRRSSPAFVTLEGELRALLAEARDEAARTAATATDVTVAG